MRGMRKVSSERKKEKVEKGLNDGKGGRMVSVRRIRMVRRVRW
jgi:hypothetical protein